ncbi:GrpB family protein [Cellulomonas sp. 179-A 4D5 NHS]|uniref:GrpB family protein n=1 Tax=Cellulomonas sp. 179-A 4D5 NHS TaxID=3142378 RepID=UPI0039A050AE
MGRRGDAARGLPRGQRGAGAAAGLTSAEAADGCRRQRPERRPARPHALDHVGSTSVPGLAAKPIIDLDLTVADSTDEAAYVPALEAEGFALVLRERAWHEHRLLVHTEPRANLHVWSPDSPEAVRHRLLRDWLREHPEDRAAYAAAKHAAADRLRADGDGLVMDYNELKAPVVREILDRVLRAHGLL